MSGFYAVATLMIKYYNILQLSRGCMPSFCLLVFSPSHYIVGFSRWSYGPYIVVGISILFLTRLAKAGAAANTRTAVDSCS